MAGVVETDETFRLRSYKGQKAMLRAEAARPPRRRGSRAATRGLSGEPVPVLVLRDRSCQTAEFVLPAAPGKAAVMLALPARSTLNIWR